MELNPFCYFVNVLLFHALGKNKWADTFILFYQTSWISYAHTTAPKLICQKSHAVTPKCNNSYFANFKTTPNYDGWVNSYLILKEQREKRLTRTKKYHFFLVTTLLYQTFLSSQWWNIHWFEDREFNVCSQNIFELLNIHFFNVLDCFLSYQTRSGRWLWRYLPKIGKRWVNLKKYFQFCPILEKTNKITSRVFLQREL